MSTKSGAGSRKAKGGKQTFLGKFFGFRKRKHGETESSQQAAESQAKSQPANTRENEEAPKRKRRRLSSKGKDSKYINFDGHACSCLSALRELVPL